MIEELENIKLIRELNYLKSDFDYKTNLVQIYNIDFLNSVENILNSNIELKKIYDEKKNKRIEIANTPIHQNQNFESEEEITEQDQDAKLKGIYRQIVKMTHPDKIKDDGLNVIYNEANLAFKEGKTVDMILLCDRLSIPFEVDPEEKEKLKMEIQNLKSKISLLESSYSYQWSNNNDEGIKARITLNYIKTSIA